ncbi:MAG TPA: hypothetical protein VEZ44_00905 [bacterium]|nr:hypothetical protein [bacterium]
MLMQVGKVQEVCAVWGIPPRGLHEFIRVGAVCPAREGRGRGSFRYLDERSLCDLYFAHGLTLVGLSSRRVTGVVTWLRTEYEHWLVEPPARIVVRWRAETGIDDPPFLPRLVFDPHPLFTCLRVLRSLGPESTRVQRGRPRSNWRLIFRDAFIRATHERPAGWGAEPAPGPAGSPAPPGAPGASEVMVTIPTPQPG